MENGILKNQYTYGANNRLEQAINGNGQMSTYQYNGLGHRVGKNIGTEPLQNVEIPDPEKQIRYTIDLTRGYHNLLQTEENGETTQTYLWDGNVAAVINHTDPDSHIQDNPVHAPARNYYLQDELGSPIRLMDETGNLTETYGYDEFGQDLYGNQGIIQPFGYTGYQADPVAGTYFAQAREYRPEEGRFGGEDIIKGTIVAPYTLNPYGYCWNNPMVLVDLDGAWPTWEDINEWVQNIEEEVKDKRGTFSVGLNLSGTPTIWQFDGTIGVSLDWKGNVAVQWTGSGGPTVGTPALGILGYTSITNAESVYHLEGMGTQIGGSYSIPIPDTPFSVMVGGDINIMGNINNRKPDAVGVTMAAGLGIGTGGEAHIEWGETQTIFSINLFEQWGVFYNQVNDNGQCID